MYALFLICHTIYMLFVVILFICFFVNQASTKPFPNFQRMYCQHLMCHTFILSSTLPLIDLNCTVHVGNCVVIVPFMPSIHRSQEPRATAGTTYNFFNNFSVYVTSTYTVWQGVTALICIPCFLGYKI